MSGSTPAFSYAQAAKGLASSQNSTPSSRIASGAITPAKDSVTSPVIPAINGTAETFDSLKAEKLQTDVSEVGKPTSLRSTKLPNGTSSPASPPFGDSSMSTLPREDDLSSQQNTSSESNWENVSQVSAAQETVKPVEDDKKEKEDPNAKGDNGWVQIQKNASELAEAPPPKVNIWTQRMEKQQAAKKTAPSTASDSSDTVGPDNGLNIQGLKREQPGRDRVQPTKQNGHNDDNKSRRSSGKKANTEEKTPAPPSMNDQASWPTPAPEPNETEHKSSLDKTVVPASAADKDKNKGKKAWAKLDIPPPSVLFQTPLPNTHARRGGRPGGRGGREGGRSSPPGRGNREDRQGGSNQRGEKESSNQSTSPKGKRAVSDETSRRDSRYPRENGERVVNGEVTQNGKAANAQEDGKPGFNSVARNGGPKNHRRQDASPTDTEKKDLKAQDTTTTTSAEAVVAESASTKPIPVVAQEEHHPKPGSTTEPLPAQRFPRNGNGHLPYQPGNRRGSVKGRGGHHGFHTPGNHQQGFQNYNMTRSPSIIHDNFYSPHMGRGGFRGGRNSIPADYGRFPGSYAPQAGMLPPLNTFIGQDMMYEQPIQPMSAVPFNAQLTPYNTLGGVSLQIEYYFSLENLIKDNYLRRHMDSQGFVLLTFIAEFKRLKALSSDMEVIRLAIQQSPHLELRMGVDGKDRVRVRDNWQNWVLEKAQRDASAQHDGVDGQTVPPMEFNAMPPRQSSLPGHFQGGYPASAYPTMNGHGHPRQEFFPSPFQTSPPHMQQPPFSPPPHPHPHMQDQMMRSPQPGQFHNKDNGMNSRSPVSGQQQSQGEQQPQPYVNGVNSSGNPTTGPNGTGPHDAEGSMPASSWMSEQSGAKDESSSTSRSSSQVRNTPEKDRDAVKSPRLVAKGLLIMWNGGSQSMKCGLIDGMAPPLGLFDDMGWTYACSLDKMMEQAKEDRWCSDAIGYSKKLVFVFKVLVKLLMYRFGIELFRRFKKLVKEELRMGKMVGMVYLVRFCEKFLLKCGKEKCQRVEEDYEHVKEVLRTWFDLAGFDAKAKCRTRAFERLKAILHRSQTPDEVREIVIESLDPDFLVDLEVESWTKVRTGSDD